MAAFVGAWTENWWFVGLAGVCALLSGLSTLGLVDRLRRNGVDAEQLADRAEKLASETDQMAARAARFEAEAIAARSQLAQAMRHEADRLVEAADTLGSDAAGAPTAPRPVPDAVLDSTTGLFNEVFFAATLSKRVSAARRGLRPLALGLVDVVRDLGSDTPRPVELTAIAEALTETLREADTVARLDDGKFALLLEDTPENGAIWTIERVRRRLAESVPGHTLWAGLSCYPAHAFDGDQLMSQAHVALGSAKEWRQDRIEVATAEAD
ncbi:MAG: diguanylate cyclase protein [Acidimicrobiales bacterium]|nr:diguanylate cyclase protein [Acidimicrobiales bacterium]